MSDELSIGVIESCVDYLRLSIPVTSRNYEDWNHVFRLYAAQAQDEGEKPQQVHMNGYCMQGAGGVLSGTFNKRALLQASGPVSHLIMEDAKGLEFDGRCTRIDAKITAYRGEETDAPLPREFLRARWETETKSGKRQTALNLHEAREKGDTLYVGAKDSPSFTRYYQAGIKHPDRYPEKAVTWEVQHNRQPSPQVFNMFRSSANMAYCAASLVRGKLASLDIEDWWFDAIPPTKPPVVHWKSTKQGTLKWYESSVKGSFRRAVRESWECEALTALGFEDLSLGTLETIAEYIEVLKNRRLRESCDLGIL